jgi:hypothetical protein
MKKAYREIFSDYKSVSKQLFVYQNYAILLLEKLLKKTPYVVSGHSQEGIYFFTPIFKENRYSKNTPEERAQKQALRAISSWFLKLGAAINFDVAIKSFPERRYQSIVPKLRALNYQRILGYCSQYRYVRSRKEKMELDVRNFIQSFNSLNDRKMFLKIEAMKIQYIKDSILSEFDRYQGNYLRLKALKAMLKANKQTIGYYHKYIQHKLNNAREESSEEKLRTYDAYYYMFVREYNAFLKVVKTEIKRVIDMEQIDDNKAISVK